MPPFRDVDAIGLRFILLPFAVRAVEPLLPLLGLPAPIQHDPGTIRALAIRALALLSSPDVQRDRAQQQTDEIFRTFLDDVATAYGADVGESLRGWMNRHEFDHDLRYRLWLWGLVFIGLSRLGASDPRTAGLAANIKSWAAIRERIDAEFGRDTELEQQRLLAATAASPVDPAERELLELEQSQPGDETEWDLLGWIETEADVEHAHRLVPQLRAMLTEEEWSALLRWIREHPPLDSAEVDALLAAPV